MNLVYTVANLRTYPQGTGILISSAAGTKNSHGMQLGGGNGSSGFHPQATHSLFVIGEKPGKEVKQELKTSL